MEDVKKPKVKKSNTVKMEKDGHTADVHPDMVDEYVRGGYVKK